MPIEEIERQARFLATENMDSDPDIQAVYWFPNKDEVRLVEITSSIPSSTDNRVHPFYFRPDPASDLTAPSGIALIQPQEFKSSALPDRWGDWDQAQLIKERK
jgi:hypothetical protein